MHLARAGEDRQAAFIFTTEHQLRILLLLNVDNRLQQHRSFTSSRWSDSAAASVVGHRHKNPSSPLLSDFASTQQPPPSNLANTRIPPAQMANNHPNNQAAMPTNTNNPPPKTAPGLPAMRFEGSNVPIYLSADPREALLLHEDLLCALNRPFEAGLRRPWTKSSEVLDPSTGETRKVAGFAIVARQGTFFLDQGVSTKQCACIMSSNISLQVEYKGKEEGESGSFQRSTLFVDNPERSKFDSPAYHPSPRNGWAKVAGADFKIMIALIYDLPITLEDIVADTERFEKSFRRYDFFKIALVGHRLIDVLALAEMHECFEKVSNKLKEMLLAFPQVWEYVSHQPYIYAELGKILECADIFFDGLQHILSKDWSYSQDGFAELLDIEDDEQDKLVEAHTSARKSAEFQLKRELRDLGLARTGEFAFAGHKRSYLTTCINAFTHRRRKQDKKRQRVEVVSLSIWSQFAIQQFESDNAYVVYRNDGRPKPRYIGYVSVLYACPSRTLTTLTETSHSSCGTSSTQPNPTIRALSSGTRSLKAT